MKAQKPAHLAESRPGQRHRIVAVKAEGAIGRRLGALGFVPGTEVRTQRLAPMGCPIEFELRGARTCLRRSEAMQITVQRVD